MGRKVLITLVSDQTIPNVLFIKNAEISYDKYMFISTDKMEKRHKVDYIIKGADLQEKDCETVVVKEDDVCQINEKLRNISWLEDDKYHVNLTGGTKIMSVAVYLFFHEKKSEIFYIPIGKQHYIDVSTEKSASHNISYRVNVKEYLDSNGVEFKEGAVLKDSDYTEAVLAKFQSDPEIFYSDIEHIRLVRNDKKIKRKFDKKKKVDKTEIPEEALNVFYKYMPELEEEAQITKEAVEYLSGGWFEELVYNRLKEEFKISEENIAINIKMKRGTSENEFDVIMTKDNALYVIECKTALKTGNGKSILTETLYKLDSLKKEFGLYVKAFLVTLGDLRNDKGEIERRYLNRADQMGIKIIDKQDFENRNMVKIILGK